MKKVLLTALAISLGLSLGFGGLCFAQYTPVRPEEGDMWCYPDLPGSWKVSARTIDAKTYGLTKAQANLFLSKLDAAVSLMRGLKVFNPPLGVRMDIIEGTAGTSFPCQLAKTCKKDPVAGRIWIKFHYFMGSNVKPWTDEENRSEAEFFINDPYNVFNANVGVKLPDGRHMARQPAEWGRVGEVTIYHNQRYGGDLYIFLTKGDRPLWVPVTREQYLTALLKHLEADVASNEAGVPPEMRGDTFATVRAILIDPVRAQLQGMTEAERKSQAWIFNDLEPLVPADSERARPVVALNPNYFDRSRPRTDFQFIVVRLDGMPLDWTLPRLKYCSDVSAARLWDFVNQVDWKRVTALID